MRWHGSCLENLGYPLFVRGVRNMSVATSSNTSRWVALSLALAVALAGCSKDEPASTAAPAATAAAPAAVAAPPAPAVSAQVQAMGAEQLRAAASKASPSEAGCKNSAEVERGSQCQKNRVPCFRIDLASPETFGRRGWPR